MVVKLTSNGIGRVGETLTVSQIMVGTKLDTGRVVGFYTQITFHGLGDQFPVYPVHSQFDISG